MHGSGQGRTLLTKTVDAVPAVGVGNQPENNAADIERRASGPGVPVHRPLRDFGLVGFDHVDLFVRDRARARRFFVEQMGMEAIGEGPDHTFLLFGDQVLGLHDAKEGASLGGIDHIALRVSEWTGLRNRIGRARVTITGEKEREDSRSLFLRGPEGLKIELVWRPDPEVHACAHPAPPPQVVPPPDGEYDA